MIDANLQTVVKLNIHSHTHTDSSSNANTYTCKGKSCRGHCLRKGNDDVPRAYSVSKDGIMTAVVQIRRRN